MVYINFQPKEESIPLGANHAPKTTRQVFCCIIRAPQSLPCLRQVSAFSSGAQPGTCPYKQKTLPLIHKSKRQWDLFRCSMRRWRYRSVRHKTELLSNFVAHEVFSSCFLPHFQIMNYFEFLPRTSTILISEPFSAHQKRTKPTPSKVSLT